jgi:hypothetical protein
MFESLAPLHELKQRTFWYWTAWLLPYFATQSAASDPETIICNTWFPSRTGTDVHNPPVHDPTIFTTRAGAETTSGSMHLPERTGLIARHVPQSSTFKPAIAAKGYVLFKIRELQAQTEELKCSVIVTSGDVGEEGGGGGEFTSVGGGTGVGSKNTAEALSE